jgi:hypothetical protein
MDETLAPGGGYTLPRIVRRRKAYRRAGQRNANLRCTWDTDASG